MDEIVNFVPLSAPFPVFEGLGIQARTLLKRQAYCLLALVLFSFVSISIKSRDREWHLRVFLNSSHLHDRASLAASHLRSLSGSPLAFDVLVDNVSIFELEKNPRPAGQEWDSVLAASWPVANADVLAGTNSLIRHSICNGVLQRWASKVAARSYQTVIQ